jgi:DnaJ-domain-containing protein 1
METRMTTLETRFNTIIPTLATKEDLNNLEVKLTRTIHQEITSIRQEISSNNWRMISWMTAVIAMAFTGVFYVAKYVTA